MRSSKASRLWRPLNVFVGGFGVRYLRSRSFVDSLVIETPATYFVLTPKNPHEFMQEVLRKRARLLPNSEEPPNHVKVFFLAGIAGRREGEGGAYLFSPVPRVSVALLLI